VHRTEYRWCIMVSSSLFPGLRTGKGFSGVWDFKSSPPLFILHTAQPQNTRPCRCKSMSIWSLDLGRIKRWFNPGWLHGIKSVLSRLERRMGPVSQFHSRDGCLKGTRS